MFGGCARARPLSGASIASRDREIASGLVLSDVCSRSFALFQCVHQLSRPGRSTLKK